MAFGPGDMVVYDSMLGSNLRPKEKSMIARWFDEMRTVEHKPRGRRASVGDYAEGGLHAFRQYGEGTAMAGLLAALHVHAKTGLDVDVLGVKIPADALASIVLGLGAISAPTHELSRTALNIGQDAWAIFLFRKAVDMFAERKVANGGALPKHLTPGSIHGEDDSDPIAKAARAL